MSSFSSRAVVPAASYQSRRRNSSGTARAVEEEARPRKVANVTTSHDYSELQRHYTFVPSSSSNTNWQDRMVQHYHSHLYKEYVLADLTRSSEGKVGLRWRTQAEVEAGKGHDTCGNKHCPSYQKIRVPNDSTSFQSAFKAYQSYTDAPATEQEEEKRLASMPHGAGLADYEVPFSYVEHGETKRELVKLRLCLKCAPLLFATKPHSCLAAHQARVGPGQEEEERSGSDKQKKEPAVKRKRNDEDDASISSNDSSTDSSLERRRRRRRRRHRKQKKHRSKDRAREKTTKH